MVRPVLRRLFIANRGEIAVRIARTALDLDIAAIMTAPEDDAASLHMRMGEAVLLPGRGGAAYLDVEAIIAAARSAGCDAVHPGYGFLSESAAFAEACARAGLTFVGPAPETLAVFGDKARAREVAATAGAALLDGIARAVDVSEARSFLEDLGEGGAVMLKAVAGGGGRGIRRVDHPDDLAEAFARCQSEARSAFGDDRLYVERFLPDARHIEIQIVGDGQGGVSHLWERDCSLQRRRQKILEIAPAPFLAETVRDAMIGDAVRMACAVGYASLGTFEFLVWTEADGSERHAFIEANPRIQVEHTVTEAVVGIDLVAAQLRIAQGATLETLGLAQAQIAPPAGVAIQARVNMERMEADGSTKPAGGRLRVFELPGGPGVRVDTYGYAGYASNPSFDSLLAKLIVHAPEGDLGAALRKVERSLGECRIAGIDTNLSFLRALSRRDELLAGPASTLFIDDKVAELVTAAAALAAPDEQAAEVLTQTRAGAPKEEGPGQPLRAPLQGTIVGLDVAVGDFVAKGRRLAVLEAMKMEHDVLADVGGRIVRLEAGSGDTLFEGDVLAWIEVDETAEAETEVAEALDLDVIRPDLAAVLARRDLILDAGRPEAVERRHSRGKRTARENVAALCDADTFMDYGSFVVAAQRQRRSLEELIRKTPADGLVAGLGSVNGQVFGPERSKTVVLAYDETVLAGTQGRQGHRKDSRLFELARRLKLPVIFFTEGGGGRPGDTERPGEPMSFWLLARMSGTAPTIGVASGYCFGGNAAFFGTCHVTIATRDASIGMGGPAMIEGGGLGVVRAADVGPAPALYDCGSIDLLVEDEAEAATAAKQCLAYFQGAMEPGVAHDQRRLRSIVPEDRRRAYDMRPVLEILADEGSVMELRGGWGRGIITSLIRIEGRPVGVVANNPRHLGGAVDGDGADKAARFVQMCDAFGVPIVMLCDTPGMMVGPEAERTALMRRSSRLLAAAANATVPVFTVITRKAYGIGMMAMMAGALKAPVFTIAWPTAEYGGMGFEGAVKLGYRKEMEAIADPLERQAYFDAKVAEMYEQGRALTKATSYEFDEIIDPADTRAWILHGLYAAEPIARGPHPFVTPW